MPGRVTFKKGEKIARIEKKLRDPHVALDQIGVLMVAESQRAFKQQEFNGQKWDERAPVNVFGIIADFKGGANSPPKRRFERRPVLIDKGATGLRGSIVHAVKGDTVEVGTAKSYAAVHMTGGTVESETFTSAIRRKLWRWLKKQSPELKKQMGWLMNKKFVDTKLKATVPARPFLGITAETRKTVRKIVGVEIMEVGK